MATDGPGTRPGHTDLGAEKYVLLTTFRRNGTGVPTPVWAAPAPPPSRAPGETPADPDHALQDAGTVLVVWTVADSWKVKRIRNNPAVLVAACTARGKPLGPAVAGRAEILDAAGTREVRRLIARKYRPFGPIGMFFSRLFRGEQGTVGLRVTLDGAAE